MKRASSHARTDPGGPRNFHLPLPSDIYDHLRAEASALRKPVTVVVREIIEVWLRERRRSVVRESIAAYAVQHAGSPVDLDPALECATLEVLRPRKRPR